jgi:hypothetical protein
MTGMIVTVKGSESAKSETGLKADHDLEDASHFALLRASVNTAVASNLRTNTCLHASESSSNSAGMDDRDQSPSRIHEFDR